MIAQLLPLGMKKISKTQQTKYRRKQQGQEHAEENY